MNDISVKKNIIINLISKYSQIMIRVFFSAVLARLLSPTDFGIFAIVNVFIGFFSLIADMGLGSGIIQNKELTKKDINNIFSASIYLGLILALTIIVLSLPIASFYNHSVLVSLISLVSITLFFNTVNMVPNALIMREKHFGTIGLRSIIASTISSIITVFLAFAGFKYYALVYQSIITAIIIFIWNYKKNSLKFQMKIEFDSIKKILKFSTYQFLFNFINYFARNLDNLLTGKIMGEVVLGFYDKAYTLMLSPIQALTYAINPMLHPVLSEYQNNKQTIYEKYIKIVKVLSLVGVFISVYCYFAGTELILIIFGGQWRQSIPCFQALSISLWFQLVTSSAGAIYQSLGNTKLMFLSGIIHISVTVIVIVIGVFSRNIVILSLMVSIGLILKFIIEYWFLIKKGFAYSLLKYMKIFLPEIVIAFISISVMLGISEIKIDNIFLSALFKLTICFISYVIGLVITRQYKYFRFIIGGKL